MSSIDQAIDVDEKTKWGIEKTFSIQRKYVGHVLHQVTPAAVNRIKRRVSNIQHALSVGKNAAWWEIVLYGLDALEEAIENGKKPNAEMPAHGTPEYRQWTISRETWRVYQEKAALADLEPIYQARGPQGFMDWCESEGIDPEPFLKHYSWQSPAIAQSTRDRDWLRGYLESCGGTADVGEIRTAATEAGMISGQSDWNRLEQNAGRSGLVTKDYGKWNLASKANF